MYVIFSQDLTVGTRSAVRFSVCTTCFSWCIIRTYTVWVIYLGAISGLFITVLHCSPVKLLFGGCKFCSALVGRSKELRCECFLRC